MSYKTLYLFSIILLLFGGILGCKSDGEVVEKEVEKIEKNRQELVVEKLGTLSIEERRGLLTMVSIPDTVLTERTEKFLKDNKISGVILFKHNIKSKEQLTKLTTALRERVSPRLLIAVDQEGGGIVRVPWDTHADVTANMIGTKGDLDFAYKVAYERAKCLLDVGINVILGPVADIASSKKSYIFRRCFGTEPEKVAKMVEITVKAQKDAGIITVLKHFPGHGKTTTDSHIAFPVINLSKEELLKSELLPFIKGVEAGAEMVMIGHIINGSIDKENPASISHKYLNLLEEIKFDGIIITDDLRMTGTIEQTIGWGINLMTGSFKEVSQKIKMIEPEEQHLEGIVELLYF